MSAKARWIPVVAIASTILAAGLGAAASRMQAPAGKPSNDRGDEVANGYGVTLLPDGSSLLTGGTSNGQPTADVAIRDPLNASVRTLRQTLIVPRAGHTATLLPDGQVLLRGGTGVDGRIVREVEIVDLDAGRVYVVEHPVLSHRSGHTSTVLSDGRVLTVGGRNERGLLLKDGELWDPATGESTMVVSAMRTGRAGHSATLQADGRVRLSGGGSRDNSSGPADEIFDAALEIFAAAPAETTEAAAVETSIVASSPAHGAVEVPTDVTIAVRFATPMAVNSLSVRNVVLRGSDAGVLVNVVPAENGRLLFIRPQRRLADSADYILSVNGAFDVQRGALPPVEIHFTTARRPDARAESGSDADGEEWIPNAGNLRGQWRSGRPDSPWRQLPPLQAPRGVTAVAGQVLLLNGKPLADVRLSIGQRSTYSDRTGRFVLTNVATGRHVLRIDGRGASRPNRRFGLFDVAVYVHGGRTNVLTYSIWMPVLDSRNAVTIPSPTTSEVVVTTPHIPGLELHIPAGTVIRDVDGQAVTSVSITPIPVDRPPFPLPPAAEVPIYFTIQPGLATLSSNATPWPAGARLIYPNYRLHRAGRRIDFWQYDAQARGWFVYGQGTVTNDRRQIVPDERVSLYQFTGAMVSDPSILPPPGPEPGDSDKAADPVDLSSGQYVMEHTDLLACDALPLIITRTYRPIDLTSRAFGMGGTLDFDMFMVGDTWPYTYQILALADGGRIRFDRTSPGTGFADAVYEHVSTPSRFHKAVLRFNLGDANRAWRLTLKDGTTFFFPDAEGQTNPYRGALTAMRDRSGNETSIVRNSTGEITGITSPNGRWMRFSYDTSRRITRVEDSADRAVTYLYDSGGRLWKVTNPEGGTTEYGYDAANRLTTIKDARGIVYLSNEYDAEGRVARQTLADSSVFEFDYTVDGQGKIVQTDVTDPRGYVRRVTFNSDGYTISDTRALGTPEAQTTTYVRQAATNLPLSITDALNRKTAFGYDSAGNVTTMTRLADTPDAVTTTFAYNPMSQQLVSITDPLSHVVKFSYDSRGNLAGVTDANNHAVSQTNDEQGRVIALTDGVGNTTQFVYVGADLRQMIDPLANSTWYEHDNAGRLVRLTSPRGDVTQYEYSTVSKVKRVVDPLGGITEFTHDGNGNLGSLTDALDRSTSYTYDVMDRVASRTDSLNRAEQYAYDTAGNLRQVTDRKQQVTNITYDPLERPRVVTYADGATVTYTYDQGDRLIAIADSVGGAIARTYDGLDRLLTEATPQGTVIYTYDAAGRRATMSAPGQVTTTYNYDPGNRLTSIARGDQVVTFGYDQADRRTTMGLPNGVTVDYDYDAASRLSSLTYVANGAALGDLQYTYDAHGNVSSVGGSWARTGLPAALASTTYDAANQLTTWNGVSVTYDANGNMTSDGTRTFTWDARNRLVAVTGAGGATFAYDGLGRRAQKNVGLQSVAFLYDGVNAIQEQTGGVPSAHFLTGLTIDEVFSRRDALGNTTALASNALSSTIALAGAGGTVQTEYTYEPFGRTAVTGAASDSQVQFTGREQDSTGLYYYRARYYNPVLQRFIAEDPLGFGGADVNLHAYTLNNPTNLTDPSGQFPVRLAPGTAPACERYFEIGQRKPPSFWDWLWCQVELATMLPGPGAMASSPSRVLGRNLAAAGAARPAGAAAHHIAAESARLADRARQILARFNIDINGAANGIFLDVAQHAKIHTKAYYEAVNRMLGQARTRAEALAILDKIRALIAAGNFPPK